jgi:hypothetical protein
MSLYKVKSLYRPSKYPHYEEYARQVRKDKLFCVSFVTISCSAGAECGRFALSHYKLESWGLVQLQKA